MQTTEARQISQAKYRAKPEVKDRRAIYMKKYFASPKGRAVRIRAQKKFNASPKGKKLGLATSRKYKYGMDHKLIAELLLLQNGCCAICMCELGDKFHADHNHKTKSPRGLLCGKHNTGLGTFNDNPALLQAGIDYLNNPPYNILRGKN